MLNKQDFSKINETELGNSQALFRDPALSGKYEKTNYKPVGQTPVPRPCLTFRGKEKV